MSRNQHASKTHVVALYKHPEKPVGQLDQILILHGPSYDDLQPIILFGLITGLPTELFLLHRTGGQYLSHWAALLLEGYSRMVRSAGNVLIPVKATHTYGSSY